jgi:splicing factor 3A subunit 3
MATLLETTRQLHEDVERLERLVCDEFNREARTHQQKLLQAHRVRQLLDSLQARAAKLVGIYDDADGARREEIAALRGEAVFANFYDRLREVRESHRRFPAGEAAPAEAAAAALAGPDPPLPFSGEEAAGRALDLHEWHRAWSNAPFGRRDDYLAYVAALPTHLEAVLRRDRLSGAYRAYASGLAAYLASFAERTQPLARLGRAWERAEAEFGAAWAAGAAPGWEDCGGGGGGGEGGGAPPLPPGALDLSEVASADALEALGGDALKAALAALGLKCGGTPRQRAERLFATKGKRLEELDRSLFAKGTAPAARGGEGGGGGAAGAARAAALAEARLRQLCALLAPALAETAARVERRAALSPEELAAERAEAEAEEAAAAAPGAPGAAGAGSDSEEEYIYNPLKLPLGWDGKPIPYWLYKLHGLNMEFKCEICGGASLWGRRAFERHFKEAQHEAGMRALGIPNTKQFFEVTTIADAVALHKTLKERAAGGFRPGADEEVEDAEGNLYTRAMFEALRGQGVV